MNDSDVGFIVDSDEDENRDKIQKTNHQLDGHKKDDEFDFDVDDFDSFDDGNKKKADESEKDKKNEKSPDRKSKESLSFTTPKLQKGVDSFLESSELVSNLSQMSDLDSKWNYKK